jgi:hypothetical protein
MLTPLDKLNAQVFREQLHTKFKVLLGGAALLLELVEVAERDSSPQMELFSLHFRGPSAPRLPQQVHRLEHERLGAFEIFLTAIDPGQEPGMLYESVFHRFRKPRP